MAWRQSFKQMILQQSILKIIQLLRNAKSVQVHAINARLRALVHLKMMKQSALIVNLVTTSIHRLRIVSKHAKMDISKEYLYD